MCEGVIFRSYALRCVEETTPRLYMFLFSWSTPRPACFACVRGVRACLLRGRVERVCGAAGRAQEEGGRPLLHRRGGARSRHRRTRTYAYTRMHAYAIASHNSLTPRVCLSSFRSLNARPIERCLLARSLLACLLACLPLSRLPLLLLFVPHRLLPFDVTLLPFLPFPRCSLSPCLRRPRRLRLRRASASARRRRDKRRRRSAWR